MKRVTLLLPGSLLLLLASCGPSGRGEPREVKARGKPAAATEVPRSKKPEEARRESHLKEEAVSDRAERLKKESLKTAEKLAELFPGKALPLFVLGKVYSRQGKTRKAEQCWEKALSLDPNHPDAYDAMAWLALERGEYGKALGLWKRALALNPKLRGARSGRARAYMGLGKVKEAAQELEKELALFPDSALDHFLLGQQYFQLRQFEKAGACYKRAIACKPDLTNAYHGLAQASLRLGRREEARRYLKIFKKFKARDMERLKDRDLAYRDFEKVKKNVALSLSEAGAVYLVEGREQEAESLFRRALEIDGKNVRARMYLAALAEKKGRKAEAVKLLRDGLTLSPGDPELAGRLASLIARRRSPEALAEAEKILVDATKQRPRDPLCYRQLAVFYLSFGIKAGDAYKAARRAVELHRSAPNYDVLSWALYANGRAEEAVEVINRAIELDPGNPVYKRRKEKLLQRLGLAR